MRLTQLLPQGMYRLIGTDRDITGIAYDSRRVQPGFLFAAIRGYQTDGHLFVPEALNRGAAALMVEKMIPDAAVPQLLVNNSRTALSPAAAAFFGYPAQKLRITAVTGTNGKTTTTYFIKQGFEAVGRSVGLVGTIQNMIGDTVYEAGRTTPESLDIQEFMAVLAGQGQTDFVFEASSHGLALGRLDDVHADTAVFTNLTQDHLDFHPDIDHYFAAKRRLFELLAEASTKPNKAALINGDDEFGCRLLKEGLVPATAYGLKPANAIRAEEICLVGSGLHYRLLTPGYSLPVSLPLAGRFNVYNSLAAAAVFWQQGFSPAQMAAAMAALRPVPGRFESVQMGQPFTVVVDYAHTPDSLVNVLNTARHAVSGRVICIVGAGGDRDVSKRPLMGAAAALNSDYVIVTADNPRSEDPRVICEQMAAGIDEQKISSYHVEVDRRGAIRQGLRMAVPGDIVVIAGKGHETYQEIKGQRHHFDDREEAAQILKELF